MTMVDTAVVGSNDEDTLFIDAGILGRLDNLTDVAVQFLQVGIIFRGIMTGIVSYMIRIVEDKGTQYRLLFLDVLHRHLAQFVGIFLALRSLCMIVGRKCIHHILDAVPFIEATDFGFRLCISLELEHGREDVVLQNHTFGNFVLR